MSTETPPKQPLIDNLVTTWTSIDDLLTSIDTESWARSSVLPGWTVRDIVAHIIGTEAMLAGEPAPEVTDELAEAPHVHNEIGKFNEAWVAAFRDTPAERVHERFRAVTSARRDALAAMSQEDFDAPSWTPVGQSTYARFMQIRNFDCWLHEQDIRDTVGAAGHESGPCAEAVVDEVVRALGYIVGKRAGAPHGATVTIGLTGPVRRTIHVEVGDRAHVVPELSDPATARLELPAGLFTRLAGGRVNAEENLHRISVTGDTDLGTHIARNLTFTM